MKSDYTPEKIAANWGKYDTYLKWGVLFYPLYSKSIKFMNEKSQELLISVVNKTVNMFQVYFDIKPKVMVMKLF